MQGWLLSLDVDFIAGGERMSLSHHLLQPFEGVRTDFVAASGGNFAFGRLGPFLLFAV